MANKVKKIVFQHQRGVYAYKVIKLVNLVEPTVGSNHREDAVQVYVDNVDVQVEIK